MADNGTVAGLHDRVEDCLPCTAGMYSARAGAYNCTVCPSGTYLEDPSTEAVLHDSVLDCFVCPAGTILIGRRVSDHDNVDDCIACRAGTYLEDDGVHADDHDDVSDCTQCPSGQYSSETGVRFSCECRNCNPGLYSNPLGDRCIECRPGMYQNLVAQSECKACPPDSSSANAAMACVSTGKPMRRPIVAMSNESALHVTWKDAKDGAKWWWYELQFSIDETFPAETVVAIGPLERRNNWTFSTKRTLSTTVVYSRVRRVEPWTDGFSINHAWSLPSRRWQVAHECDFTREYLNTTGNELARWACNACPTGAYCTGQEVTWQNVKALFGWWRRHNGGGHSNFSRCLFPPACLGAPNPEFNGLYNNASGYDVSLIDRPEMCAFESGYARTCAGDGAPRCRLCATCAVGFRRRIMDGLARCDACPAQTDNRWKLAGGGVLAVCLLALLVRVNLSSGGVRTTTEMYQVIVINYLQQSAMVVGMDVPWPALLQTIFGIQGAVSTIGEHLLAPDCEVTTLRPAMVAYYKQIGYIALPWIVWGASSIFWRLVSTWKGVPFSTCNEAGVSYCDKHVSTMVFFLYLLFPTMCGGAFALLTSRTVDGRMFMFVDLQEPFLEGRHLTFVFLLVVPQMLFIIGLIGTGFYIVRQHALAQTLSVRTTQIRYGMLYSGYQYKRWWWDVVVASRKVLLALVSAVVPAEVQVHVMVFILFVSFFLNERGQPYVDEEALRKESRQQLHNLDGNALAFVLLTAWSGTFFKNNPHCESKGGVCTVLMVLVAIANVFFGCFCLYVLGKDVACLKSLREKWFNSGLVQNFQCHCRKKLQGAPDSLFETGASHANPMFGHAAQCVGPNGATGEVPQLKVSAEWEKKVVEMRTMRAKSRAGQRR